MTAADSASARRSPSSAAGTTADECASSTRPSGCRNSVTDASAGSATGPPRTSDSTGGPSSTELAEYHQSTPTDAGRSSRYRRAAAVSCAPSQAGSVTAVAVTGIRSVMPRG